MTTPRFYDAGGAVTAAGRIRRVVPPTWRGAPFPAPDQETRCVSRSASTARSSRDAVLTTPSSPRRSSARFPASRCAAMISSWGGARAAVLNERGDLADLLLRGLRIGQDAAEQLSASLVASPPGQGQQHCALALAQIVAGRLAGGLRRTEDPQLVVAQLEGDTDVLAEGGQVLGGGPARVQTGQESADEQRVAHRVAGRLVPHDRQGIALHAPGRGARLLVPGQGQVLAAHVEELAQATSVVMASKADRAYRTALPRVWLEARDGASALISSPARDSRRSPSRMAPLAPKVCGRPSQPRASWSRAKTRCAAGRPRRVSAPSMRSSWTRALAW